MHACATMIWPVVAPPRHQHCQQLHRAHIAAVVARRLADIEPRRHWSQHSFSGRCTTRNLVSTLVNRDERDAVELAKQTDILSKSVSC
eukprot:1641695-Pleurochrysis_carterae.AAC.1